MEDNTFLVYEYEGMGSARATEEVVLKIAALAACEVEGVECLGANVYKEHIEKMSRKAISSCIKIVKREGQIDILMSMVVKMGISIPELSRNVQEKVKSTVESMLEIKVGAVNIQIANMKVDK